MYLRIKNIGEINAKALTLIGASSKDGEKTIGQYGSGTKYAMAYLLRNNHKVKVFSGETEIKIHTEAEEFQDQGFDVIYVNDEKTSITTRMGKDWKLWQAIREFYSNAIDEGEEELSTTTKVIGEPGYTSFYISINDELIDIVTKNFTDYFADESQVLHENEYGKILEKSNDKAVIYRRGIRCYETSKNSLYNYDIPNISINESRVAEYSWDVHQGIWKILISCTDKKIIKNVLTNLISENIENEFVKPYGLKPSDEFIEVCNEINLQPSGLISLLEVKEVTKYTFCSEELFSFVSSRLEGNKELADLKFIKNEGVQYRVIEEPTQLQMNTIQEAENFLSECKLPNKYPIKVGKFSNPRILGLANSDDKEIILSENGLDRGIHDVVNTIIEEYIHLEYDVRDCTREFQLKAIDLLINYAKEVNSYNI